MDTIRRSSPSAPAKQQLQSALIIKDIYTDTSRNVPRVAGMVSLRFQLIFSHPVCMMCRRAKLLPSCIIAWMMMQSTVHCAKLRSWLGPETFWDGSTPVGRSSHGFTSSEDGQLYVFGGWGLGTNGQFYMTLYLNENPRNARDKLEDRGHKEARQHILDAYSPIHRNISFQWLSCNETMSKR